MDNPTTIDTALPSSVIKNGGPLQKLIELNGSKWWSFQHAMFDWLPEGTIAMFEYRRKSTHIIINIIPYEKLVSLSPINFAFWIHVGYTSCSGTPICSMFQTRKQFSDLPHPHTQGVRTSWPQAATATGPRQFLAPAKFKRISLFRKTMQKLCLLHAPTICGWGILQVLFKPLKAGRPSPKTGGHLDYTLACSCLGRDEFPVNKGYCKSCKKEKTIIVVVVVEVVVVVAVVVVFLPLEDGFAVQCV